MSGPSTEKKLAMLDFAMAIEPSPAAIEMIRPIVADAEFPWTDVAYCLSMHGILALAVRNLLRAGITPPADVIEAALADIRSAIAAEETTRHFLHLANRMFLRVILLKGTSLAVDVYPGFGLRSQGDVDILVRFEDLDRAVLAAREIGYASPEWSLPIAINRLYHFHAKMVPRRPGWPEIEVHWGLDAGAGHRGTDQLRSRVRTVEFLGARADDLDPLDRFLHLVTHAVRHALDWPRIPWREFASALADAKMPSVRLKWVLDIVLTARSLAQSVDAADLAERAREWRAGPMLLLVGETVRDLPSMDDATRRFLDDAMAKVALSESIDEIGTPTPGWAESTPPSKIFGFRWASVRQVFGRLFTKRRVLFEDAAHLRYRTIYLFLIFLTIVPIGLGIGRFRGAFIAAFVASVLALILVMTAIGRAIRRRELRRPLPPEIVLDLAVAQRRAPEILGLTKGKSTP